MSGRKESKYWMSREREAQLRRERETARLRSRVFGLRQQIGEMLGSASAGLLSTFADRVDRARDWCDGPHVQTADDETLRITAEEGEQVVADLVAALTHDADEMAQRLAAELAEQEGEFLARRDLLALWYPAEQIAAWEQDLRGARTLWGEQRYSILADTMPRAKVALGAAAREAETNESRHQQRLYLLRALRQVCVDMGFQETISPHFEDQSQRGSPIRFEVDTVDRGSILFTVALDGIASNSELTENKCHHDFASISQSLEEEFGVHTAFRPVDGRPDGQLLRRGERDLPGDSAETQQV